MERQIKRLLYDTDRVGMPELVNFLIYETDFFSAPASTKHHLAHRGGLAEHSLSVYQTMVKLNDAFDLCLYSDEIATSGLLHDLCKTNYYQLDRKFYPDHCGIGEYRDEWKVNDELPLGHGEKSLYLVSKYLNLSDAEAAAIRWHMGAWTPGVVTDRTLAYAFNAAAKEYPLLTLLISADFISSRLMEGE